MLDPVCMLVTIASTIELPERLLLERPPTQYMFTGAR
jgi:hypothetical protein